MHKGQEMPSGHCGIIKIKKEEEVHSGRKKKEVPHIDTIPENKPTSMSNLILWNISKVVEMNPYIDLKCAIRAAQLRLECDPRGLNTVVGQNPEQQHLVCALLAWQQLGHQDADSLYRFIESNRKEASNQCSISYISKTKLHDINKPQKTVPEPLKAQNVHSFSPISKAANGSFGSHSSGPVLKLPVETKVVLRLDHQVPRQFKVPITKRKCGKEKDTTSKIDAACCLDSACVEWLSSLDATTKELRSRASKLARREAERVELLERAEAAWKDLESGYQRRLALAIEKEDDINKQIQKCILERNEYKSTCTTLALELKDRGDAAEKERAKLTEVEKCVCCRACTKLRLSEESAKCEASLAEQQCLAAQYERDLQFKEEQARRKLVSLENEADSARALTHEAERAMRAELSGLREQIGQISNKLLEEDEANVRIREELNQLREEKMEILEDLEGCKMMCDLRMQARVDALAQKKVMLNGLKDQVMECRCKMPVDKVVEVKRTPSLAAMCMCAPEDKFLESCSCTSLRGRLLSSLLADLFGGLQTELIGSGVQMPCQLLKCLEDNHNWDRTSVVKTNLRNFFSKLLIGELDIAIATSIENYHAKWVGASCADVAKMRPEPEDDLKEGWEQRALERRAQQMASELAEQLFQERAKEAATSGPPPCKCKQASAAAAVYPCLTRSNTPFSGGTKVVNRQSGESPVRCWKRTIQDVTQIKLQIEDLKKESIKKEDLILMEEKIAKIVKQASVMENEHPPTVKKGTSNSHGGSIKRETKTSRTANIDEFPRTPNQNKSGVTRKKPFDNNTFSKKKTIQEKPTKQRKNQIHGQSYAVNLCLCGIPKNSKNLLLNNDSKSPWKQKPLRDIVPQHSIVKQTKPININQPFVLPSPAIDEINRKTSEPCSNSYKCFHKVPSNTSIDKLLETLAKWKCDLADPQEKYIHIIKSSLSKYSKTAIKESMRFSNQNDSKINLSISTSSNKEKVNESDICNKMHKEIIKKSRSAQFRPPVTIESEYLGAVNLDKSNDNISKCIPNIESRKKINQDKKDSSNNNIPLCINSNACECKMYREMHKNNKRSQTEKQNKGEDPNQLQALQTKTELYKKNTSSKSNNHLNNQKEIKLRSNINQSINNVDQKTEICPSNCDYYIKFLGVTLDDLDSHNKVKRIIKDVDNDAEGLLISKDKYLARRKKHQRKLSNIEPCNSFTKPNVITIDGKDQSGFNETSKCECNAKFDEFKMFMNNFLTNQLKDNTIARIDEGLDSQSFKYTANTIESCVCCNNCTVDDSKDLEMNAFHLLENHLKEKLEEFKSLSCKSTCIPPEDEEKLFSAILQRVKQVISSCAHDFRCSCPGGLPKDGSWNRAYGLLQEYLKMKIKRVQCSCVLKDNKDSILPDILEKVCNLIENDFQRLKDICKCKNSNETRQKYVNIEDVLPAKESPVKDTTNISPTKYNIVEVQNMLAFKALSKQNSNKSIILRENISSQVPPNLGMEAKACDVMDLGNKNAQTTETDTIITDTKTNGVMYSKCDCCYNTDKQDDCQFSKNCRTNKVSVNFYTDKFKNTNDICGFPKNDIEQGPSRCLSADKLNSTKPLPKTEIRKNYKSELDVHKQVNNEQSLQVPYIGYTVDCTCDGTLGSCICMKSVVQTNNDKIDNLWKKYLTNHSNCNQDFSYIMHGAQNKDSHVVVNNHTILSDVLVDDIPKVPVQNDNKVVCDTEVSVQNEDEVMLKYSRNHFSTLHQTTNTFVENLSSTSTCTNSESRMDWDECPVTMNSQEKANTVKLTNSIYFPVPIEDYKKSYYKRYLPSETITDTDTSKSCDCDKVPICHVKMLVQNIEKNLLESKCTCDSISKVCPVHSTRAR